MMDTVETLYLQVIQGSHKGGLPLQKVGFHVVWTGNVDPYKEKKVRILNGAYTSMVLGAHLYRPKTVGECLKDERVSALSCKCIFREIIPIIGDTGDNREFGETMLGQFSNPFIRHMLLSIALNSVSKFRARVFPIMPGYGDMSGSYPQGPTFSLVAPMAFYRINDVNDSQKIMDFMKTAPAKDILKREDYWGQDLSPPLADVKKWYELIKAEGTGKVYGVVLNESKQMPVRHK